MRASIILTLVLAAPAAGYATETDTQWMTGGLGDTIAVGEDLVVIPLAVLEDSRCPAEVDCVQSGDFVLKVAVQKRAERGTLYRSLGKYTVALQSPVPVDGGSLALTRVTPPRSLHGPKIKNYQFTLGFNPWVSSDGAVAARLGQTVDVGGPKVTPLRVLSDGRCRQGRHCRWEGRIKVEVRIDLGSRSEIRTLSNDSALPVADGQLELVRTRPRPPASGRIDPASYVFSLRFRGGL